MADCAFCAFAGNDWDDGCVPGGADALTARFILEPPIRQEW